jgi:peptidyl-prolyl isomerase E (cyclophilin E)
VQPTNARAHTQTSHFPSSSAGMAAKNMLYVSGLAEDVKEEDLFALFGPFGDIIAVQIPINANSSLVFHFRRDICLLNSRLSFVSEESRGFGFVTFESAEDAAQALDNMDDAEYFGSSAFNTI